MYKNISKLTIYRDVDKKLSLFKIAESFRHLDDKVYDNDKIKSAILDETYKIIELAKECKFDKDIWASYLTYVIATSENPFSLEAERTGFANDTLKSFALNDFQVFIELINYDFSKIEKTLGINCFTLMREYKSSEELSYNNNLCKVLQELNSDLNGIKDENDFCDKVLAFYKKYGVGNFGLYKAFRIKSVNDTYEIVPISGTSSITLSNLIGYEEQKKALTQNTEAFISGKPANNVLLYGDAGTGKSSSIKSLINMYYDKGLRMIEIYKQDFKYLPELISILKNRNYRFIIYFDDLSFEKSEIEYKYLKAVIEGGLEVKPENVLVYATSNRMHLLHETFSDRKDVLDDDVHVSDTLTEQTSLADRFGLSIGYFCLKRQEYFDMVCELASRYKDLSNIDKNELIKRADLWNRYHGDLSGRAAQQFINSLL